MQNMQLQVSSWLSLPFLTWSRHHWPPLPPLNSKQRMPVLGEASGPDICCETSFVVIRIMRDGTLTVFATGKYLDRVRAEESERLVFSERIVVCDNANIDALLALPL